MLKIKFWRVENVLLMKVLEQGDEIKRGDFKFCASNGVKVTSISSPELTPAFINIRGRAEEYDDSIVPCEQCWLATLKRLENTTALYQ